MQIQDLQTPSFLLDLDVMERNIKKAASLAKKHGKQLCPMTKTHKSTGIAKLQSEEGIDGFVVGTLNEAEAFSAFAPRIMLPYPVVNRRNLKRIHALQEKTQVIIAVDSLSGAKVCQTFFSEQGAVCDYLLIVDVGLHRLGVQPENVLETLKEILAVAPNLRFKGIGTHPGHVYACKDMQEVKELAERENALFLQIKKDLEAAGIPGEIFATGSTPTFGFELLKEGFTMLRPGNYVFNDLEQVALGVAQEQDCALTVLASVIAHPFPDLFIMDCGSKCLALDKGAHGSTACVGYGYIIGHPEAVVEGLSEEVGKLRIKGETTLKVGDLIRIIPNHACPVANLTSYFVGVRGEQVERVISIDVRNNTQIPGMKV